MLGACLAILKWLLYSSHGEASAKWRLAQLEPAGPCSGLLLPLPPPALYPRDTQPTQLYADVASDDSTWPQTLVTFLRFYARFKTQPSLGVLPKWSDHASAMAGGRAYWQAGGTSQAATAAAFSERAVATFTWTNKRCQYLLLWDEGVSWKIVTARFNPLSHR